MMNLDLLPLPAMMGNGDWIHPVALGTGIIRTDGGRDGFQTTFNEQQETATPESRKASKGAPPPKCGPASAWRGSQAAAQTCWYMGHGKGCRRSDLTAGAKFTRCYQLPGSVIQKVQGEGEHPTHSVKLELL